MFVSVVIIVILCMCNEAVMKSPFTKVAKNLHTTVSSYDVELDAPCHPTIWVDLTHGRM